MEHQNLNQEQKLHVILCGPLEKTERALLRRGDVEIKRGSNLNLMGEMVNEVYDCDMIIVQAPYGHGLYSMTYPVREDKRCPVWMVADPPDAHVWKEINFQLDNLPEKNRQRAELAARTGPPKNEIVLLAGEPETRGELTTWTREICAGWGLAPELTAPEDVKAYLRGLHYRAPQEGPPELVVIALPGVDGLNAAEHIRRVYPKTSLVWCCDLDFALQAYDLQADFFFPLEEISREKLEEGLTRWGERTKHFMDRGSKQ